MHVIPLNHTYVILAYPWNVGPVLLNKIETSFVEGQTIATLTPIDATRQCQSI